QPAEAATGRAVDAFSRVVADDGRTSREPALGSDDDGRRAGTGDLADDGLAATLVVVFRDVKHGDAEVERPLDDRGPLGGIAAGVAQAVAAHRETRNSQAGPPEGSVAHAEMAPWMLSRSCTTCEGVRRQ